MAFKKFVDIIETLQDIAQICARAEPGFEHRGGMQTGNNHACQNAYTAKIYIPTK
jgi:hypothetical protein